MEKPNSKDTSNRELKNFIENKYVHKLWIDESRDDPVKQIRETGFFDSGDDEPSLEEVKPKDKPRKFSAGFNVAPKQRVATVRKVQK